MFKCPSMQSKQVQTVKRSQDFFPCWLTALTDSRIVTDSPLKTLEASEPSLYVLLDILHILNLHMLDDRHIHLFP